MCPPGRYGKGPEKGTEGTNDRMDTEHTADRQKEKEPRFSLLEGQECLRVRELWESCFGEDGPVFTDYYFQMKAPRNTGLILETDEKIVSMLYLTPYCLRAGRNLCSSSYFVGVATRKEYRHRGYMARLLAESLKLLKQRRQPFAFLMPASPKIYEPFEFVYIYDRPVWKARKLLEDLLGCKSQGLSLEAKNEGWSLLREEDCLETAEFANIFLEKRQQVFVQRDASYYYILKKEMDASNGGIFLLREGGRITACVAAASSEDGIEVQELLAETDMGETTAEEQELRKPVIMGRIVSVTDMFSLLSSRKDGEVWLYLKDELLEENTGLYRIKTENAMCMAQYQGGGDFSENPGEGFPTPRGFYSCTASGLTEFLFGRKTAGEVFTAAGFPDEESPEEKQGWEILNAIIPLRKVWINETV